MWRLLAAIGAAIGLGCAIAYAQIINPSGGGGGTPGGANTQLQFNTGSTFGGISGVTSDSANVGFATSSQLFLYGTTVGDCLKVGANNQIADFGAGCGGSGSPGGLNTQVQFNTAGTFGGVAGATSNGSNISFTTNSLVINGQAISGVSGTTGTLGTVTGALGSNCVQGDGSGNLTTTGVPCATQTATPSIAAGSNITTSGTPANVTVNVVANPSFTTVIASGNITAGTAQFTGAATGTTATFQTITDAGISAATQCVQATNGIFAGVGVPCATQTSTPSIAAGSNITTSGTAANTTINVVATPSFTTVIATGNLTGATAQITGFLTAGGASLSGLTIQTGTFSGNLTGTSANFSSNLTAGTAQFTGQVTGTSAVFQTVTVSGLTPTGPNCLQETGGVLQATNAACASPTSTSIAAGTNIQTYGTASNITVAVSPAAGSTQLQYNNAGALGSVSGATSNGANVSFTTNNLVINGQAISKVSGTTGTLATVTGTLGSNCVQGDGNGNLITFGVPCATQVTTPSIAAGANITTSGTTANISVAVVPTTPEFGVQYNHAGVMTADSGFTSFSGITTHTLGNMTTTNARAVSIIETLSSGTVLFDAPLFMNVATNAFASGSKLVDIQGSGISYLSVFASTGMTVLGNITSTLAQITGWLTGPGANFQTATIAGALIGSTGNFSSNLTASTVMGVVGWLTAPGTNMQTASVASNLTGSTVVGIVGWLTAPGVNMQTATLAGALNGSTGNFTSNLTGQIGAFPGFLTATGTNFFTSTISQLTATSVFVTSVIGNAGTNSAGSISFLTNNVAQFGDGGLNANGYYNWGGEARLSADSAGLITTGFGNVLTVNVKAGRTYKFDAELPLRSATASTGGIGLRIGGGAAATAIVYDGWVVDSGFNGTKGNTQATALSTTVASTSITGTTSHATLIGTISVSAAGTIILQASAFSTVTAASAVTIGRGATFIVEDMP